MRIAIFGTVGAGKTTLINNFNKLMPEYEPVWEPLQKNPYFSELYTATEDIQNITYRMEIWMLAARMKQLLESKDKPNVIFDRGVMDTVIFADTNHALERISDRDYKVYEDYFEITQVPSLFSKDQEAYDLVVYLKVDDQTSIDRITKRGIANEQVVDHSFWKLLNQTYDKWYEKLKDKVPFLVIDGNNDSSEELASEIVDYIKNKK